MIREQYDPQTQKFYIEKTRKKDILITALAEGHFLTNCKKKIGYYIGRFFANIEESLGVMVRSIFMRHLPVKENRIVFGQFQNSYTCNGKYIAEKIMEKGLDYELIFIVNKTTISKREELEIPKQIRLVERDTMDSFVALGSAHFWIDNALNCVWRKVPKKKGQIYLNTWHGSLGIKVLGGNKHWIKIARAADKTIDYFLTDSVFDEHVFAESFWPHAKFLKVGHPRNDIFFNQKKLQELKARVYEYYNLDPEIKTVMYAPTFRDNKSDVSSIRMDCARLKATMEQKFGGEWRVIVRMHMHNAKNRLLKDMFEEMDGVINASGYRDMQELMAAVDVGITDYSSWIFDFIFTRRPAFIYALDISQYIDDRGFYYPLTETPFTIADSDDALNQHVMEFDDAEYQKRLDAFFESKGCYERGTACEGVVDFICEHTKQQDGGQDR